MTDKEKINAIRAEVQNYIDAAHKAHTNITEGNFAHLLSFIDSLQEEPASEELEEYSALVADELPQGTALTSNGEFDIASVRKLIIDACKFGAKWQEEQFEKNRLAHCDDLTAEQAQIESDFVVNHLKKNNRTPTFIDAIEYGMRLQKEKMMKDATDVQYTLKLATTLIFRRWNSMTMTRIFLWQRKEISTRLY